MSNPEQILPRDYFNYLLKDFRDYFIRDFRDYFVSIQFDPIAIRDIDRSFERLKLTLVEYEEKGSIPVDLVKNILSDIDMPLQYVMRQSFSDTMRFSKQPRRSIKTK